MGHNLHIISSWYHVTFFLLSFSYMLFKMFSLIWELTTQFLDNLKIISAFLKLMSNPIEVWRGMHKKKVHWKPSRNAINCVFSINLVHKKMSLILFQAIKKTVIFMHKLHYCLFYSFSGRALTPSRMNNVEKYIIFFSFPYRFFISILCTICDKHHMGINILKHSISYLLAKYCFIWLFPITFSIYC